MATFDIPASPKFSYLDLNNLKGLDSSSIAPDYMRASDMINIVKKDGLHRIRSSINQSYTITTEASNEDDKDYNIKYVGKVEEYEGSNPVPYYIKISEKLGPVDAQDGSSLYISVWATPLVKNIAYNLEQEPGLEDYLISYKKYNFTNYGPTGNRQGLYESVEFDDKTWVFTPIGILSFNCNTIQEGNKKRLVFDVVNVLDNPYIPTIVIGSRPDGTDFTKHEDINLLGNKRKVRFLSDGASTVYKLPEDHIMSSNVKVQILQENGLYADKLDGYEVDYVGGRITFSSAIPVSPVDGMDNVIVEYSKNPVVSGEANSFNYETTSIDKKLKAEVMISKDVDVENPSNIIVSYTMRVSTTNNYNKDTSGAITAGECKLMIGNESIAKMIFTEEQMQTLMNGGSIELSDNGSVSYEKVTTRNWTIKIDSTYTVQKTTGSTSPGSVEQKTTYNSGNCEFVEFRNNGIYSLSVWSGMYLEAEAVPYLGQNTDGSDSGWIIYATPGVWAGAVHYLGVGNRYLYVSINGQDIQSSNPALQGGTNYRGATVELRIPFKHEYNGGNIPLSAYVKDFNATISGVWLPGNLNISGSHSIKLPLIALPTNTISTTTSTYNETSEGTFTETPNETYTPVNYQLKVPGSARLSCYYGTKAATVYGYESDRRIFVTDGTSKDTFSGVTKDGTSSIYYFPDTNYRVLGEDTEIIGYAQTDGYLMTIKKGDDSVYVRYAATLNDTVQFPAGAVTKNLQILARPIQVNDEILVITPDGISSLSYKNNECRTYLKSYFINSYFQLSSDYNYDKMQWYVEDNLLHIMLNNYDFVCDLSLKSYIKEGNYVSKSSSISTLEFQYDWYVNEIPNLNVNYNAPKVVTYYPKDFERQSYGIVYTSIRPIGYSQTGIYEFKWNDYKVDTLLTFKEGKVQTVRYPIKAHYITPFLDIGDISKAKTIRYLYINTRSNNNDAFLIGYINEEGMEEVIEKVYSGIEDYTTKYRNSEVVFPKLIQIKSKIKKFMNIKLYIQNIADRDKIATCSEEEIGKFGDMTFDRILVQYQSAGKYRGE